MKWLLLVVLLSIHPNPAETRNSGDPFLSQYMKSTGPTPAMERNVQRDLVSSVASYATNSQSTKPQKHSKSQKQSKYKHSDLFVYEESKSTKESQKSRISPDHGYRKHHDDIFVVPSRKGKGSPPKGKGKNWKPMFSNKGAPSYVKGKGQGLKGKGHDEKVIGKPTIAPSRSSSAKPTRPPTKTLNPTFFPTPAFRPTVSPTVSPSKEQSGIPSPIPSSRPSTTPTDQTSTPSAFPTRETTSQTPSNVPSTSPTKVPTSPEPSTKQPSTTSQPTTRPSQPISTSRPSSSPTVAPSRPPTRTPSSSPAQLPTLSPSILPSSSPSSFPTEATPSATSSPTSPSQIVQASPFGAIYTLETGVEPTSVDYAAASDLTLDHIDQFMATIFASIPETSYLGQVSFPTSETDNPVSIDFDFTAIFGGGSQTVPLPMELDQLIEQSMSQPTVDDLIDKLRALPSNNPFSTTTDVSYFKFGASVQQAVTFAPTSTPGENILANSGDSTISPDLKTNSSNHDSGISVLEGLAGVCAAGILIGTIGLVVMRMKGHFSQMPSRNISQAAPLLSDDPDNGSSVNTQYQQDSEARSISSVDEDYSERRIPTIRSAISDDDEIKQSQSEDFW